jgi:hypothetical protein
MQEEKLTQQERRVLKAFSGSDGKTIEDARNSLGEKPSDRQLRNIIRELKKAGHLIDLDEGVRGPHPHRYIPVSDSFGAVIHYPDDIVEKMIDGNYDNLLTTIHEKARNAITAITASSRSRKSASVERICNEKIKPVLKSIYELRGLRGLNVLDTSYFGPTGEIVLPGEYFTGEFNGYLGYEYKPRKRSARDRKGTLRIRHPDSNSEEDWFYPSLEDWKDYLLLIVEGLDNYILAKTIESHRQEPDVQD